jgi:hypothetical protein
VVQSKDLLAQLPLPQERILNQEIIYLAPVPSAVIITRNADIELAAREVAVVKFSDFVYHSTSAPPGFAMVDEFVSSKFLAALEKAISSQAQNSSLSTREKDASVETGFNDIEKSGGKIKRIRRGNNYIVLLISNAEWK